jgi:hypothetical protein
MGEEEDVMIALPNEEFFLFFAGRMKLRFGGR